MEVNLGYFDRKKGTDIPVEARLFEINDFYKGGITVEVVEFFPNETQIWDFKLYKF